MPLGADGLGELPMLPAGRCGIPPPPIGLAGRGGVAAAGCGAMGRAGAGCGIDGVAGLGIIAGFGTAAAAAAGFFAAAGFVAGVRFAAGSRAAGFLAAGLRAGALRAVVFRAAGRRAAVLRAVVLRAAARRAVLFRAGAFLAAVFLAADFLAVVFFAAVFCAPVFFAPDRAALALRPVVLRELVFLLAVRFFPVVLVAMVLLRFSSVAAGARGRRTRACTNHVSQVQACRPTRRVNCFFSLYADRSTKWQFGGQSSTFSTINPLAPGSRCNDAGIRSTLRTVNATSESGASRVIRIAAKRSPLVLVIAARGECIGIPAFAGTTPP